jgi:speckle-type POZ protein
MASASTNLTGAARVVHLLKIDGYSASTTLGDFGFFKSTWNFDGYEWEIHLYPATPSWLYGVGYGESLFRKSSNPLSQDEKTHWDTKTKWLAVKFVFLGTPRESLVRAAVTCRLVDSTGVLSPSEEKSVAHVFRKRYDCSSGAVLMENRDLAASGYLRGDSLVLECAITVLRELPVPTIPAEEVLAPPSTNLHEHLGELLQRGTGADVNFLVSGESFAAHKLILASRSPVFMAEFFGAMKEKCSQRVEINDMEAAAFGAMLHFIYTDSVPELEGEREAVATMAQHLLAAADRYGLERLKLICEIKLSGGITVNTVATTLALAEQHNYSQLMAKCAEFIVSTPEVFDAVLATEGYKHLEASCPSVLTELLKSLHERIRGRA